MAISKKNLKIIVLLILLVVLAIFQIQKRNAQKEGAAQREAALKATNTPFKKVLFQLPIYRDSIYKVYLVNILSDNKIVFLRKGEISEKQRESSFFVHIYPKDKNKLEKGSSHIPNNFKNNVTSFFYNNEEYFISETTLPEIKISKLNLGQFGFRGNNAVSWKISELLIEKDIGKVLKENREDMEIIELIEDSF